MARIRNISADTVYVQHLAREVKPDEVVEIPDDHLLPEDHEGDAHPEARVWPSTIWHVVGDKTTPAHPAPTEAPAE